MKWLAFLVVAMTVAGCVAQNSEISFVGPSGQQIHSAKCSQAPESCYAQAAKTCEGPYQVMDSESHAGGLLADILPGPVTWYGLTYSCGKSDGRLASFNYKGQQYVASEGPSVTNCQSFGNTVSCQHY